MAFDIKKGTEKASDMFQKAAYKHYYALLDKQKKQILESHIG